MIQSLNEMTHRPGQTTQRPRFGHFGLLRSLRFLLQKHQGHHKRSHRQGSMTRMSHIRHRLLDRILHSSILGKRTGRRGSRPRIPRGWKKPKCQERNIR